MNKHMRLVFILLVSFLTLTIVLGTVSAAEIETVNTTDNIELKDNGSNDINTFSDLNRAISLSNSVELTKDIIITKEDTKSLQDGICIDSVTMVKGNGHSIDANGLSRIFNIKAKSDVSFGDLTLVNLTLKNGLGDNGGAIYSDGYLNLINCTLINNHATDDGGAICYRGKALTVINCTFINNYASSVETTTDGGAIWSDSSITLINSTFKSNHAANDGGAIYSCNYKDCSLNNCTFINNYASNWRGGAVYVDKLVECRNCTFIANTAPNGGAIYIHNSDKCLIKNCIFKDNLAEYKPRSSSSPGEGGAIYFNLKDGWLILIHNQWINNHATDKGDRVYNNGGNYGTIAHNYFSNHNEVNFRQYRFIKDKYYTDEHPLYDLEEYQRLTPFITDEGKLSIGPCPFYALSIDDTNVCDNITDVKSNSNDRLFNYQKASAKEPTKFVSSNSIVQHEIANNDVSKNSVNKMDSVAKSSNANNIVSIKGPLSIQENILSMLMNFNSKIQNMFQRQFQYLQNLNPLLFDIFA